MPSIRSSHAQTAAEPAGARNLGTADHDLGTPDRDAGKRTDSIEEIVHISVQILDPHRTRDIPRSQFDTQRPGQRSTRPEHPLRMHRAVRLNRSTARGSSSSPIRGDVQGFMTLVGLDESLDGSVVGAEPQHPSNRSRNEQITFDVTQTPDKNLEPDVPPAEIRTPLRSGVTRWEGAVGG